MSKLANTKLLEIVAKVGDTPAKEPDLFNMIMEEGVGVLIELPNIVLEREGVSTKDFKREEIALFVNEVVEKVRSLKGTDGFYKETKKTKGVVDKLSYEDCIKLYDYAMEQMNLDIDEDAEKIKELQDATDSLVWEIANIKKDGLSDWEQLLVSEQIKSCAYDTSLTALGRELKG